MDTNNQRKERVIYNKEVQTMEVETETPDLEAETLQRGVSEIDLEALQAARDRELEEESVQLDKEIEEEIRGALFFLFR